MNEIYFCVEFIYQLCNKYQFLNISINIYSKILSKWWLWNSHNKLCQNSIFRLFLAIFRVFSVQIWEKYILHLVETFKIRFPNSQRAALDVLYLGLYRGRYRKSAREPSSVPKLVWCLYQLWNYHECWKCKKHNKLKNKDKENRC